MEGVIFVTLAHVQSGPDRVGENPQNGYGYLRLVVSGNGCGMTGEIQVKIFDPCFTTKFSWGWLRCKESFAIIVARSV
jgi:signal transduction histidine kinase